MDGENVALGQIFEKRLLFSTIRFFATFVFYYRPPRHRRAMGAHVASACQYKRPSNVVSGRCPLSAVVLSCYVVLVLQVVNMQVADCLYLSVLLTWLGRRPDRICMSIRPRLANYHAPQVQSIYPAQSCMTLPVLQSWMQQVQKGSQECAGVKSSQHADEKQRPLD